MDARSPGAWQTLLARQARDFAAWPVNGGRFVDEAGCLAAVMLAIGAARALGIGNVGWAAFSAYMVSRPNLDETVHRAGSRAVGTAVGVELACLVVPAVSHSGAWMAVALALVGGICLYLALLDRRAFGALFAGMAFAMVLIDGMEFPDEALGTLARTRLLDVCVGSGAALLVSAIAALVVWRGAAVSYAGAPVARRGSMRFWHPVAFVHALQGAIALALLPWVWSAFHLRALSQSSTTILAVMMVPVLAPAVSLQPTARRMRHRFVGCGIGALFATGILMLSHRSPLAMTLAVCCGVVAGRHVENGALDIGYVGTQFALAVLVVLVPDGEAGIDVHAGLSRLTGIVVGIALLQPVRRLVNAWIGRTSR